MGRSHGYEEKLQGERWPALNITSGVMMRTFRAAVVRPTVMVPAGKLFGLVRAAFCP